ncbi:hypothetical protein RCH06_003036 [Polaromonas sp. CG_9.5]|uniref:hypothetical protein n=1 Tax=Polaromonas sp. CG_9.5 TaxID=3071705 RepID=UPI002E0C8CC1|nr:hypothetical protein [Polaromonas sp. CG_9.5]
MNHGLKFLLIVASASLGACALMPLPNQAVTHKVSVNGETHLLTQITDSTWTARSASSKPLASTPASTAALRMAVEQASGCKVTDSDYSGQGRQFDAQVDCGSKLPN